MGPRSVGVEEELLLVDPDDGRALAVASAVLHDAAIHGSQPAGEALTAELTRQQIETNTRPCTSLNELGSELRRWRQAAAQAARAGGAQVAALATAPQPVAPSITPNPRYREMMDKFGLTAEQQLTCGCHIHVEVDSDAEGVAVLDRIRGWLPTLLALSGNSPFWQGEDTGYADVCQHPDDTVLLAGLTRALVETAARAWRADRPPNPFRVELLRLAGWRAGRSGLDGSLIDPTGRPAPARRVVRALIEHVRPALEDLGEYDVVQALTDALFGRGNGSTMQRDVCRRGGSLADVVASAVTRTAGA